jgi:hypothetical protein
MAKWNLKELFTDKVEFAIKVNGLYYPTDQLIDLNTSLRMLLEIWKTTNGTIKDAPIRQDSSFTFDVHKSADFYSSTGQKTLGDFRNNTFVIPPVKTEIVFKITGKSEDDTELKEEYLGTIEEISSIWTDTDGTEKVTVSGIIKSKVT